MYRLEAQERGLGLKKVPEGGMQSSTGKVSIHPFAPIACGRQPVLPVKQSHDSLYRIPLVRPSRGLPWELASIPRRL